MSQTTYTYYDKSDKKHDVKLSEALDNQAKQAKKNYETGKRYFFSREFHIRRQALKNYHLSTYDRKIFINSEWKSNIPIGMTRAFVDIFTSAVNERPLTFIGTPINKKGLENKGNILKTLNYIADVSLFHKEIKKGLNAGLMMGEIIMRVNYMSTTRKTQITSIVNDKATKSVVTVDDSEVKDYPTATTLSVFNVFPDPYNGKLRYITERNVVSHFEFKQLFSSIINRTDNKSPFKTPEFIDLLPLKKNQNSADFTDYGTIVDLIHQKVNEECQQHNKFIYDKDNYDSQVKNTQARPDKDSDVTDGMIEFLITTENDIITIHANNYPVYIGPNFYGFINYVWENASGNGLRYGEGIPYLLNGIEKTATSFINNSIDGARAIASPTFIGIKNLLINENQLESGAPGGVIWVDGAASVDTQNAIRRLDKGGITDFGTYDRLLQLAQQITGISEYNMGIASGERTATGALATTQSSQKRISPYVSSFVNAMSQVAQMWFSMVKKNWTRERFIYVLDDEGNQVFEEMQNKNLLGGINISLQAEGLFGSTSELNHQKLISMYQTIAKSPNINTVEIEKDILEETGFNPEKYIIQPDKQPTPNNMSPEQRLLTSQVGAPTIDNTNQTATEQPQEESPVSLQEILQRAANPQVDLGNDGRGQQ